MVAVRGQKMLQYVNWRMRVTLVDSRQLVGTFMAFDKHMNLVLGDCEEYRMLPPPKGATEKREVKRVLGLVLVRGEEIVSLAVEAPPPQVQKRTVVPPGGGAGRAAGRGAAPAGMPPGGPAAGLGAPVRGLGGPAPAAMQPQGPGAVHGAPVAYGRGMPPPGAPPPGMPPGMLPPGMHPPGVPPPGFP
eukprot:CAMPEP_0119167558 /NCGR_PEP_ID=MMETSP1315-20130426/6639_1 /TAXON_ID=676789 /ORGANISM="Prasinoderma singularis, Strain RCC927" /LENGTH=187 /DNA_ID=CAMNT_0007161011 /DNA_START=16 /DNA_END=575 /DNA_ORIENTATION=+